MGPLGGIVHDIHDRVVSVSGGEFHDEIHTDFFPPSVRDFYGVEFPLRFPTLHLSPITEVTCADIDSDVAGHLRPPVIPRKEFQRLPAARVSGNGGVVMLGNNSAAKVFVIGDVDLAAESQ
jgi:hypothetical protein